MRIRSFELVTVLLVAVAVMSVDTPAAAAQARSARGSVPAPNPGRGALPPRTPDGHPDLQGTWDFRTLTPLERPSDLAGKQVLTDEEAAALEQRAAQNRVDRAPRAGDPGTYEFTVDDPTVWARPWTAAIPMKKTDDRIYEYACHEGNHGMVGILTGARADEKAAEKAAKTPLK
jgi:hypothetical protein